MYNIPLPFSNTAVAWRSAARALLEARILPEQVLWSVEISAPPPKLPKAQYRVRVPVRFLDLANTVVWHSNQNRFDLLYLMAFRLQSRPDLVNDKENPDMAILLAYEQDVWRAHKQLKNRLHLHDIKGPVTRRRFAGWVDTQHDPLELTRQEFTRRFSDIDVSIFTPKRTAHWKSGRLMFQPATPRPALPKNTSDPFWAAWLKDQVPVIPFTPSGLNRPSPELIAS